MTSQLSPSKPVSQASGAPAPRRLPIWLRAALGPVALAVSYVVVMVVFQFLPRPDEEQWQNVFGITIVQSVAVAAVFVALVVVLLRFVERRPLRSVGLLWTRRSIPMLLIGVVISVGVVLGSAALTTPQRQHVDLSQLDMPLWAGIIVALVTGFVLQGFPEELAFRGYLLSVLGRRPILAAVVSAVTFGLIHLASNGGQQNTLDRVIYLLPAAAFGLTAAALTLLTRSLWAAVGVHGGMHTGFLLAQILGLNTGVRPYWLVSAGVHLLIAAALLVVYARRHHGGVVRFEN